MGCIESRFDKAMGDLDNYNTLSSAYIRGSDDSLNSLAPIDQLEFLYKSSLPAETYGDWDKKAIELDEKLQIVETDETSKAYAESAQKQVLKALEWEENFVSKAHGIAKAVDEKQSLVGGKYKSDEAVTQLSNFSKAIKKTIKKPGEQLEDTGYNGIKNFPRLCLAEAMKNEYIFDKLKSTAIKAEVDPKEMALDTKSLAFGALNAMISKCLHKAQTSSDEANSYKLPDAIVWVAARAGEENYKTMVEMYETYKSMSTEQSMGERAEIAKKTVMVFPGITRIFISKEGAMEYLNEPLATSEKLIKVLFKIQVDVQGNVKPMDAKKFFDGDAEYEGKKMGDGAMQRLMIQVQEYSIEGADGEDVNPELLIKKIEENGGSPGKVEDIYKMTHIFFVRQLENENDPNKATNLLDYQKESAWKSLFEKEAKKKVAAATE